MLKKAENGMVGEGPLSWETLGILVPTSGDSCNESVLQHRESGM